MSIKELAQVAISGAKTHKAEIMIGFGLVAGVGAIIVAVKETPKCIEAMNAEEEILEPIIITNDQGEEKVIPNTLDLKTKLVIFGKHYWKVAILEAISIVLIIYGSKIRLDSYAALVAVYGVTKAELDDLKRIISEQPENWKKKFTEKVAESHMAQSNVNDIPKEQMSNAEIPMPLPLFWDDQAKVYFRKTEEDLRDHVAEFTNEIITDPFQATSMNDWMRILGHEDVVNGDYYLMRMDDADWDGALKYKQIDVKEAPNGEPCRVMRFNKEYHLDARGLYCDI